MIRTAIISVTASFVLFGAWTVNLVSYHPANDLNPLAPLQTKGGWKYAVDHASIGVSPPPPTP